MTRASCGQASEGPSRRMVLGAGAAVLATGAGVVLGPMRLAADAASRRPRLVVMIARGGLDGLSFAPPLGDVDYVGLRGAVAIPQHQAIPLDRDFGLHPSLKTLGGFARSGRVRLAPAAALWTPDRSHFRAQDLLETGTDDAGAQSGWLRRAADLLFPGGISAMSVGGAPPLVLQGPVPTQAWSPDQPPVGAFAQDALAALYHGDPLGDALDRLGLLATIAGQAASVDPDPSVRAAAAAAQFLAVEHGASLAVLSLYGFDTHVAQGGSTGASARAFGTLDRSLAALQRGLGLAWSQTAVLIITEFGRTAAVNGVGGTDHGAASSAVLTGGAVRPGAILGDWPGLAPTALFESRDLRPALDLRALFKGVLMEHFGLDQRTLATRVFPGTPGVRPLQGLMHVA